MFNSVMMPGTVPFTINFVFLSCVSSIMLVEVVRLIGKMAICSKTWVLGIERESFLLSYPLWIISFLRDYFSGEWTTMKNWTAPSKWNKFKCSGSLCVRVGGWGSVLFSIDQRASMFHSLKPAWPFMYVVLFRFDYKMLWCLEWGPYFHLPVL